MPPPASISPGGPSIPSGSASSVTEIPHSQPLPVAGTNAITPETSALRNTPAPSRLPPRINSSQPPSSQTGFAITTPSRNMIRAPPPLSSTVPPPATANAPIVPMVPTPSHTTGGGPGYAPVEFSFPSQVVAALARPSSDVPFPIDSSQIDPQLMGPTGFTGTSPLTQQEAAPGNQGAENRPAMGLGTISVVKTPRPRRARHRKLDTGGERADEITTHDDDDAPSKRRRSRRSTTEGDDDASRPSPKRHRHSGTTEPRKSRKRAHTPPPFDPDADPGEELDPTVITMAALCDDSGRGRVSSKAAQIVSNHAAWRAANRDKRARMKAIMEAKKYGRNTDEDDERSRDAVNGAALSDPDGPSPTTQGGSAVLDPDVPDSAVGETNEPEKVAEVFDYGENMAVSRFNVQVRIGANGETIIDEESLFVNRNEEDQTEEYTHVEESDFTKFVNSATYSKKLRGSRWSAEETELFYDALSQFGENYELISYVLPGRDRKACKNKFKAEDKKDPARITYCLNNRRPYDIETLSRMTGKDFSGPTPDIRAPTPLRSTELETPPDVPGSTFSRAVRKKSRTPSFREAGVELVGDIDDVEREEFESISAEGTKA
ncbi:hypothetical protein C8Q78DRAFT_1037674 [Trametes maxima]|nr:hypothetical protein C8Q78DRAFT_1037674 [Trametes maxima]